MKTPFGLDLGLGSRLQCSLGKSHPRGVTGPDTTSLSRLGASRKGGCGRIGAAYWGRGGGARGSHAALWSAKLTDGAVTVSTAGNLPEREVSPFAPEYGLAGSTHVN